LSTKKANQFTLALQASIVTESDTLKAAKISRTQAIVVALVTAIGGFATSLATNGFGLLGTKNHTAQHWIKIETVQTGNVSVHPKVRVTADVNGVSYSFPTNTVWAAVGAGMAGERYPLPTGAESYRVKFRAFVLTDSGSVAQFENRDYVEHLVKQIPVRNASQDLNRTGPLFNWPVLAPVNGLIVRYSIE